MRKLTGKLLEIAQAKTLDSLVEPTTDKRFDFYTQEDSKHQREQKLCKATLIDSIESLDRLRNSLEFHYCRDVGIDVETTGFNHWEHELLGVGFACMNVTPDYIINYIIENGCEEIEQFFDIYYVQCDNYPGENEWIIEALAEILQSPKCRDIKWYLHNAKFDMHWLRERFNFVPRLVDDSMIMAYVLRESKLGIDMLAPKYLSRFPHTLKQHLGKDKITPEDMWGIDIEWIADYCGEDCLEGVLLSLLLRRRLWEEKTSDWQMGFNTLRDIYEEIDLYCLHSLVWAEETGCLLDWDKLNTVGDTLEAELWGIECEIAETCEMTLEEASKLASSPAVLSNYLYEVLKLPTKGLKPTKFGFSTAVDALNELKALHPLPRAILDYRQLAKLNGTYIKGFYERNRNHRLHTTFNNCLTDTGRLSSSDPNLQNIPNSAKSATGKLIRQCFVTEEGNVLVKADYSQFELRILAHFSQDPYLLDAYRTGKDVHSVVSCLLFDLDFNLFDPDANKEHKKFRTLAKTINFGLIYGMTAHKLLTMCVKAGFEYDLKQCEGIMTTYWAKLEGVTRWMAYVKLKAIRDGYTETIFGRRRYFEFQNPYLKSLGKVREKTGNEIELTLENWKALESKGVLNHPKDAEALRACGNAPIQGSNADAIRIAMGKIYETYYGTEVKLLLNVHDEIVLECPWQIQEEVGETLSSVMQSVITLDVPVVVEPSIATSWGDT